MMIKLEEINFLFSKMKFNKSTLLGDLILSPHPTFTTYWRFTASLIPNTSSKTWKCRLNIGEEPVLLLFSLALLCYPFKVLGFDVLFLAMRKFVWTFPNQRNFACSAFTLFLLFTTTTLGRINWIWRLCGRLCIAVVKTNVTAVLLLWWQLLAISCWW